MPKRAKRVSVAADAANVTELRDKLEKASYNKRFYYFLTFDLVYF